MVNRTRPAHHSPRLVTVTPSRLDCLLSRYRFVLFGVGGPGDAQQERGPAAIGPPAVGDIGQRRGVRGAVGGRHAPEQAVLVPREDVGMAGSPGHDELGGERSDSRELADEVQRVLGRHRAQCPAVEQSGTGGVTDHGEPVAFHRRQAGRRTQVP
ncbi:hypothetical protein ACFSVJ_25280 [Prauserella oleivorans]